MPERHVPRSAGSTAPPRHSSASRCLLAQALRFGSVRHGCLAGARSSQVMPSAQHLRVGEHTERQEAPFGGGRRVVQPPVGPCRWDENLPAGADGPLAGGHLAVVPAIDDGGGGDVAVVSGYTSRLDGQRGGRHETRARAVTVRQQASRAVVARRRAVRQGCGAAAARRWRVALPVQPAALPPRPKPPAVER